MELKENEKVEHTLSDRRRGEESRKELMEEY
jgi:hypothetical protein